MTLNTCVNRFYLVYRYKKFNLGNDIELIVRCEHDAVMVGVNGELQFINIKTLNEWDPRVGKSVLCLFPAEACDAFPNLNPNYMNDVTCNS